MINGFLQEAELAKFGYLRSQLGRTPLFSHLCIADTGARQFQNRSALQIAQILQAF